jgi:hypothetical protein
MTGHCWVRPAQSVAALIVGDEVGQGPFGKLGLVAHNALEYDADEGQCRRRQANVDELPRRTL